MKVAVLGAGAMGCLYAAFLAKKNDLELFLIDHNPEKVDTINRQGLVMQENGVETCTRVKAVTCGHASAPVDILFVFVKANQTAQALSMNPGLIAPGTTVVSLQNGMNNDLEIAKFVPQEQIILGTSSHNSTLRGYGKFMHGSDGVTAIGPLCGAGAARVKEVCGLFSGTGISVTPSPDVRRMVWRKLFINLAINPLTMLLQKETGIVASDANCWNCACQLVEEGLNVAAADGFKFDRDEILGLVREVSLKNKTSCSSMYQDRMRHRPAEIDFINGAVVALGQKYHIATPANALIVKLVHAAETGQAGKLRA